MGRGLPSNQIGSSQAINLVWGRYHTRSRLTLEAVQASTTKERDCDSIEVTERQGRQRHGRGAWHRPQHETDVRRFWDAMRERLGKFALSLHPDKTRLIGFGRYAADRRAQRGLGKPESFSFLGFTFICGKSRQGTFQLKRKTRRDRMRAKLRAVKQEMRRRMHQPIPLQGNGCSRSSAATSITTPCRRTVARSTRSVTLSLNSGNARSGDAVRKLG
jgi:hypothetical protein